MMSERLEIIKNKIIKLIDKKTLIQHGIKNDCDGYLYCIYNSIYQIYSREIYKLGNTIDLIDRIKKYNNKYFDEVKIMLSVKVPYKFMFETLLFLKLKNFRIKKNREFFTNYDLIKKEFEFIKIISEKYKAINLIEKYYEYVVENIIEDGKYLNAIKKCQKINYELKPINYLEKFKNKIKNHISNENNNGYLLHIDIEELSYNFDNNIQVFMVVSKFKLDFTEFLTKVKVKNIINIYDVKLVKYMLYDLLNNTHIKNKYFMCSNEKAIEIINKISYYYDYYSCVEKIKKAYLYDIYNEGIKIEKDKKSLEKSAIEIEFTNNIKKTYLNRIELLKKKFNDDNYNYDLTLSDNNDIYDFSDSELPINIKNKKIKEELINNCINSKNNFGNSYISNKIYNNTSNKKYIPIKKDHIPTINYTIDDFKYNKRQLKLKEILDDD